MATGIFLAPRFGRMSRMSRMGSMGSKYKRKPCTEDKPYRSKVAPFRCLKHGSVAARKQGICPPRTDRSGRLREYVPIISKGKKRCVVAGGKLAKTKGTAGCPRGKVRTEVVKRVPQWIYDKANNGKTYKTPKTNASGRQVVKTVKTLQCVRARGKHANKKQCPVGKVLASKRRSGMTPSGGSFNRQVTRCVKASTAARNAGYTIISNGTLPNRKYKRAHAAARTLERTRNPKVRSKKTKAYRVPIQHGRNPRTKHVGANLGWRSPPMAMAMSPLMAMAMSPRMIMSLGSMSPRRSTRTRMAR